MKVRREILGLEGGAGVQVALKPQSQLGAEVATCLYSQPRRQHHQLEAQSPPFTLRVTLPPLSAGADLSVLQDVGGGCEQAKTGRRADSWACGYPNLG